MKVLLCRVSHAVSRQFWISTDVEIFVEIVSLHIVAVSWIPGKKFLINSNKRLVRRVSTPGLDQLSLFAGKALLFISAFRTPSSEIGLTSTSMLWLMQRNPLRLERSTWCT